MMGFWKHHGGRGGGGSSHEDELLLELGVPVVLDVIVCPSWQLGCYY